MKKLYLLGWMALLCGKLSAQSFSFRFDTTARVSVNGRVLTNAWAGGLNAPQFSRMHLNADAVEDLVVFDRTAAKLYTFVATPSGASYKWTYAPEYQTYFPLIDSWMLLRDYDGDGRKDLFARTPAGVRVFHNETVTGGPPIWMKVADPLYTQGFSGQVNMQVPSTDIPGIADLDGDGDLDFVIFDSSGNFAEYHQNQSVETSGKAGLIFKKIGYCWGNFIKEFYGDACFNIDCDSGESNCPARTSSVPGGRPLHAGNTLLLWDLNGDGLQDVLFSYIEASNVALMYNEGTKQKARFTKADYLFPAIKPVDIHLFPAIFSEDVTFDGKPDFLAAPNVYSNDALKTNDFRATAWLYENTGTTAKPELTFRKTNFLQDEMVDLGENTTTALADIDGDGDMDLLAGYAGIRNATDYRAGIALFRNTGNAAAARFERDTLDFMGLAAAILAKEKQLITDVRIFVADVSGDGVPDVGFAAETPAGTILRYLPNKGVKGGPFQLVTGELTSLPLPAGFRYGDIPLYIDLDRDGKIDLLRGTYYGGVQYYRNTGSNAQPVYQLMTDSFGGLADNFQNRGFSLLATDLNGDERADLVAAFSDGSLKIFDDFQSQPSTGFVSDTAIVARPAGSISDWQISTVPGFSAGDLDGDGLPELITGTGTGGFHLLKNYSKKRDPEPGNEDFSVGPNPTRGLVTVRTKSAAEIALYSLTGQLLGSARSVSNTEYELNLSTLPAGVYLVRAQSASLGIRVRKIVRY